MNEGKDYVVQVRVKNGPMLRAVRRSGMSVAQLSKRAKVSEPGIYNYLNLKRAPIRKRGISVGDIWRKDILRIASALNTTPENLFPAQHLSEALDKNFGEFEADLPEMVAITSAPEQFILAPSPEETLSGIEGNERRTASLEAAFRTLRPREEDVLRSRFGFGESREEETLEQIAQRYGVGRERIRQIEATALRKMRHPDRKVEHEASL